MKVRPLHDWIIIERNDPKELTTGGIIIPDVARDLPTEGTIIAIGPGRYRKEPGKKERFTPTTLKPGHKVCFMEYATQEIELDGKEIIFIREEDILGTLEDSKQLVIKESHQIEATREHPLMPHAAATPLPPVPPSEKKVKKKKPSAKKRPVGKMKRAKKEKAPSRTLKTATKTKAQGTTGKKTTKPAKKVTLKKTAKKVSKKKTAPATTKKSKTAKKGAKGVSQKHAAGKKATQKKKSAKGSGRKKR